MNCHLGLILAPRMQTLSDRLGLRSKDQSCKVLSQNCNFLSIVPRSIGQICGNFQLHRKSGHFAGKKEDTLFRGPFKTLLPPHVVFEPRKMRLRPWLNGFRKIKLPVRNALAQNAAIFL